jgi:hypothetical protein
VDETGYVYMRSRYYDSGTGRFISEDPSGLAGGINLYIYAGNNPINYRDPTGLTAAVIECTTLGITWKRGKVVPLVSCYEYGQTETIYLVVVNKDDPSKTKIVEVTLTEVTDQAIKEALLAIAMALTGGSPAFTPEMVIRAYQQFLRDGRLFSYPGWYDKNWYYVRGFSSPEMVGFREDVWDEIRRGTLDPKGACQVVGHEGVHLILLSQGWPPDPSPEGPAEHLADAITFGCR